MTDKPSLIHVLSANRWGGIEKYALDICSHFHEQNWNVCALTRDAKIVDEKFIRAGIPLLHAPLQGLWEFRSAKILSQKIKQTEGPIIVHVHGFRKVFMAAIARRLSGRKDVRIVMTRHKVRKAVDSWMLRKVYRNIDSLIFGSRTARDRFFATWQNRDLPISIDKIFVLHNSLNIPKLPYSLPEDPHPFTVMFHGILKPGKGLETLIDAMAFLKGKRIRLRIVGGGSPDYVDKLRRRAIERGVMDLIEWKKLPEDIFTLIKECDLGVLPSLAEEAFGMSNLEYMAAARPQISSSTGAQPEYITDGREGVLIPPENPVFLADTITKMASDKELLINMGARAYQSYYERFDWQHFILPLQNIYLSAISE